MNKWIKYAVLFLVVFKITFSGILLSRDEGSFSADSDLNIASAQEGTKESPVEADKETDLSRTDDKAFSNEKAAIFTSLEKKRLLLSHKEEQLRVREERLNRLKKQIEDKIAELKKIEVKIEEMAGIKKSVHEEKLNHLAKVYESTTPEQAGPMISKLDVKLAADILMRINGRKAGKIWAFVQPQRAVKISEELARKKKVLKGTSMK